MTLAPPSDQLTVDASRRRRSRRGSGRPAGSAFARSPIGYLFVSPYALLTIAFGIIPSLYAVVLAFTNADGGFAGFDNFTKVVGDFRFWPAVLHVTTYLSSGSSRWWSSSSAWRWWSTPSVCGG